MYMCTCTCMCMCSCQHRHHILYLHQFLSRPKHTAVREVPWLTPRPHASCPWDSVRNMMPWEQEKHHIYLQYNMTIYFMWAIASMNGISSLLLKIRGTLVEELQKVIGHRSGLVPQLSQGDVSKTHALLIEGVVLFLALYVLHYMCLNARHQMMFNGSLPLIIL